MEKEGVVGAYGIYAERDVCNRGERGGLEVSFAVDTPW